MKLLLPRCSGDGLQRGGRATPSLLPVQINVAVPAGKGEAGSVFYRAVRDKLVVWKNKFLCQAPVMVMGRYCGGGENHTFFKLEEKGTHLYLQVLSSPVLTWLRRCSADILLFSSVYSEMKLSGPST